MWLFGRPLFERPNREELVPDNSKRVIDFPEAKIVSFMIQGLHRDWYIIDGREGLYRKSYYDGGDLRARYRNEVLWFSRQTGDEESILCIAEWIKSTKEIIRSVENVAGHIA